MKKIQSIQDFIHFYRIQRIKSQTYSNLARFFICEVFIMITLCLIESYYYLNTTFRQLQLDLLISISLGILFYILLSAFFHYKQLFNNSSNNNIAHLYRTQNPKIGSSLLSALQLEASLDKMNYGRDLAEHAINTMLTRLQALEITHFYQPIPKKLKGYLALSTLLLLFFFNESLSGAFIRMITPEKYFPIPLPFTLNVLDTKQEVLGGDSLNISITGVGLLPDSIDLQWQNSVDSGLVRLSKKNDIYSYSFQSLERHTTYKGQYKSTSWLSPWKKISTRTDTIFVIDRPVIQNLSFTIIPPAYTNITTYNQQGNITDIILPEGSHARVQAMSSKSLMTAWIILNNEKYTLNTLGNKLSGTFQINTDQNGIFYIQDLNKITNLNPSIYKFQIISDNKPELLILNPQNNFELDESNLIGFDMQIIDDYGFNKAWIEYQIIFPEYLKQDTIIYVREIPELVNDLKSQQIYHEWNIKDLSLSPEDELHIYISISDNNKINKTNITRSHLIRGRYPSIEDLFNRLEDEEESIENYTDEIEFSIEDVQQLVEELELELLKSDEVTWQNKQNIEQTIEKMDEIFSQVENIQKTLEKIEEQASKNNLISDDLINKFSEFQDLLDEVMTPELLEAMEKMEDAAKEMDPQKLLDALENFEFDIENFEDQLDRFIDMFELAIAEQKMDEVVKRLEKLFEEQLSINEELHKDSVGNMTKTASRERKQEESFKALNNTMQEAIQAMKEISPKASDALSDLAQSELSDSVFANIQNARMQMQNQNKSKASSTANQAEAGLEEMLEIAQNIQSDFQEDTVDEMLRKFLALINNLLNISKSQEILENNTRKLRSRSPKITDFAIKQNQILRANQQFIIQLTELSRETFHISPEIASAIGKTKTSMDKTIAKLEQKQVHSARNHMKNSLKGLNQIAYLLLKSANQMQMSGSGSGFAQFMESLEKMSQAQEGINQGTMQLSQMSMMAQQQMMEKLQQQQQQLQQQLEELLSNDSGSGKEHGGLSKVSDEMDEVINDFRNRQVDRQTKERQQRILSRMLDSQKSLTQKDYSEKRKSSIGEQIIYSGPTGLPENMGEREVLLINAMESALKEGHSYEYQKMMKKYFRDIQENSRTSNE